MSGNPIIIQHSMNGGEVSARMEARQDQNKYLASLATCRNWLPLTLGGITRRPGFYFAHKTKNSGDAAKPEVRVLPFVFSGTQAYVEEVGDTYIRIYKNGALVPDFVTPANPLELTTPYTSGMLSLLQPFQSADVQYIPSGIFQVQKVARVAANPDNFTFSQVNFDSPATQEDAPTGNDLGAGTLTLAATTGSGVNFTAQHAVWLAGDVGRIVSSGAGRGIIASITSTTVAVVDIVDDFAAVGPIADTNWTLSGPYLSKISGSVGQAKKTSIISADIPTFRSSDVGKFIVFFDGTARIDVFTDSQHVTATNLNDVFNDNSPPSAATPAWTMEVTAWSDALGFPTCGCFFGDRMWLCRGQTLYGSVVGDFENFAKGSTDDSAVVRTISDDRVEPIRWIKAIKTLLVGAGSAVYECTASADGKPLTPNDFKVAPVSSRGAARIAPVRLGGQIIYVQNGQKKVRELTFDILTNRYKSPSLLQLAEHLTEGFYISDLAYQQEPDSLIWAVRNDGALLTLVYQEEEQVAGWAVQLTDGRVRSVCTIPRYEKGKDWLWAAVDRDINGTTETFIEYIEPDLSSDQRGPREWAEMQTDAGIITTHDDEFVISGLDYLEGETVRVIGDGMIYRDQVVTGGEINLDPQVPVSTVEVGLDYESLALTLEPVLPAEVGGPFLCRGYVDVGVRIRRTLGLTLNGEEMVYRKPGDAMDAQVPLQRGKKCIVNLGYDAFGRIEAKQTLPLPAEILSIVGKLHIADRWLCDTVGETFNEAFPPPVPAPEFGRVAIPLTPALNECIEFTGDEQTFVIENGCGFFVNLCVPDTYVGLDSGGRAYTQATYRDSAVGTAISGPALSVAGDATRDDFEGYAAVYNSTTHVITLGKWTSDPLSSIPETLGTFTQALSDGDKLRISKKQSDNVITVSINGITIITVTDSGISFSNPGFGIIGVGTSEDMQTWDAFTVSCSEYVGQEGAGHGATDNCCDSAPGGLTIQCCSDTCDFPCETPVPGTETAIILRACGGTPPYRWSSSDTGFVVQDYSDPDLAVVTVGANRAFMYAQVAYGIMVQPWPFADQDPCVDEGIPPPGQAFFRCICDNPDASLDHPPVLYLRPFQAEYDCAGTWLRNSLCDEEFAPSGIATGHTTCPVTDDNGNRLTTTYGSNIALGAYCYRNGFYRFDHLSAFSMNGIMGSPLDTFDTRATCTGVNDQHCQSPCAVGIARDLGTYPGPCQFYVLTNKKSATGANTITVSVEDALGNQASVIIDVT